jgi:CheY-like chemotaxis protein
VNVLVVDDNTDAAQMLSTLLTLAGHRVHTAFDAEECLAVVGEVDPDACILDIGLPGMNGYELARRLRARASARRLYLIALTGYGQQDDRDQAFSAGFDEHMTKPVKFEALESALARVLPN